MLVGSDITSIKINIIENCELFWCSCNENNVLMEQKGTESPKQMLKDLVLCFLLEL